MAIKFNRFRLFTVMAIITFGLTGCGAEEEPSDSEIQAAYQVFLKSQFQKQAGTPEQAMISGIMSGSGSGFGAALEQQAFMQMLDFSVTGTRKLVCEHKRDILFQCDIMTNLEMDAGEMNQMMVMLGVPLRYPNIKTSVLIEKQSEGWVVLSELQ